MNSGAFGEGFPYSNFHDLNMDWIIKIAKDFLDQYTHIQDIISAGEQSILDKTETGLSDLQDKYDTLSGLLDSWYATHSEDIAGQLASALADLNAWYTQHQNYLNATLTAKIAEFSAEADRLATAAAASIPADYSALSQEAESAMYRINNIFYILSTLFSETVNMLNPLTSEHGRLMDDGTIANNASNAVYDTTTFIKVMPNTTYALSSYSNGQLFGWRKSLWEYDADKTAIENTYANVTDSKYVFTTSATTEYLRISYRKDTPYMLVPFTNDIDYVPFDFGLTDYMKEQIEPIATFAQSKNLFDIDNSIIGAVQNTGNIATSSAWQNYRTSPLMPVTVGDTYTLGQYLKSSGSAVATRKIIAFFDSDKHITENYYNETGAVSMSKTVPAGSAYMMVTAYYPSDNYLIQLEKGTQLTAYSPFYETSVLNKKVLLSDAMSEQLSGYQSLDVDIANNKNLTIITKYGSGELKQTFRIDTTRNQMFEFYKDYLDNSEIHGRSDDICPFRIAVSGNSLWTIGANHGWWGISIPKQNLATEDIGSTWTDGVAQYIVAQVDDTNAYFIESTTFSDYKLNLTKTLFAANLTHVTGATHTTTLTITGQEITQIYPAVNKRSIKYYANGKEVEYGHFNCSEFNVVETYSIIDYEYLGTYLQNNLGATSWESVQALFDISVCYSFKNNSCVITTGIHTYRNIEMASTGFIQTGKLSNTGNKLYFYTNNQDTTAPVRSDQLFDATTYSSPTLFVYKNKSINPDVASNRFAEIVKTSQGNFLYGFIMGYIPDYGITKDENRKALSTQGEWRSTAMKNYPAGIDGLRLASGNSITGIAYYNYIEPSAITNRSVIETNNGTYVIIDSHVASRASVKLPTKYIGKPITIIESNDFTLCNDIVNPDGITFTTPGYGCAILKI